MIQYDSQKIKPKDIFVAIDDGNQYIGVALHAGSSKIIKANRISVCHYAKDVYGAPDESLVVIGITGTNGKTTITYLLSAILERAGYYPVVIGTINARLTTPESLDLFSMMAIARDQGKTHFIMEVSSIGIDQHRVDNIAFKLKLLTNITIDHLDYHHSLQEYSQVKFHFLFNMPGKAIFPRDFMRLPLLFPMKLLGRFNRANAKAAMALAQALKISYAFISETLSTAVAPKGRFEPVIAGQPFRVIVDYAHTPDGLKNLLETARELVLGEQGNVIVVFGCGGNRDHSKRPLMGHIAEQLADIAIVTSDNPRNEVAEVIATEVLSGMTKKNHVVIIERREAICYALTMAKCTDVVVVAGKGHETVQIIGVERYAFDDHQICEGILHELFD